MSATKVNQTYILATAQMYQIDQKDPPNLALAVPIGHKGEKPSFRILILRAWRYLGVFSFGYSGKHTAPMVCAYDRVFARNNQARDEYTKTIQNLPDNKMWSTATIAMLLDKGRFSERTMPICKLFDRGPGENLQLIRALQMANQDRECSPDVNYFFDYRAALVDEVIEKAEELGVIL